jgi:hypothetical protein
MINWKPIEDFPQDMINVPVLLYSEEFKSEYEPTGIIMGFLEDGPPKYFLGSFWNNYQDTFDCSPCSPTHFALLTPPA